MKDSHSRYSRSRYQNNSSKGKYRRQKVSLISTSLRLHCVHLANIKVQYQFFSVLKCNIITNNMKTGINKSSSFNHKTFNIYISCLFFYCENKTANRPYQEKPEKPWFFSLMINDLTMSLEISSTFLQLSYGMVNTTRKDAVRNYLFKQNFKLVDFFK